MFGVFLFYIPQSWFDFLFAASDLRYIFIDHKKCFKIVDNIFLKSLSEIDKSLPFCKVVVPNFNNDNVISLR